MGGHVQCRLWVDGGTGHRSYTQPFQSVVLDIQQYGEQSREVKVHHARTQPECVSQAAVFEARKAELKKKMQ